MDPSVDIRGVIDASVACAIVIASQALYCWLQYKGALSVPDSRRTSTLFWLSSGFGLVNVAFLSSFVKLWKDNSSLASFMLSLWKISSEISISGFEVSPPTILLSRRFLISAAHVLPGRRGVLPHPLWLAEALRTTDCLLVMRGNPFPLSLHTHMATGRPPVRCSLGFAHIHASSIFCHGCQCAQDYPRPNGSIMAGPPGSCYTMLRVSYGGGRHLDLTADNSPMPSLYLGHLQQWNPELAQIL